MRNAVTVLAGFGIQLATSPLIAAYAERLLVNPDSKPSRYSKRRDVASSPYLGSFTKAIIRCT